MPVDLFVSTQNGMLKFSSHEILYIQSSGSGSRVVTNRGEFLVRTGIGKLEKDFLPPECFCRVDRSYIVSLENVHAFKKDAVVVFGNTIPLSKAYRNKLFSSVKLIW